MLAHMGCWGGGFCLLCRQASMARWAQYYSRGSSAANLCLKVTKSKEEEEDGKSVMPAGMRSTLHGGVRWAVWGWLWAPARDLIGKACVQLPASQRCVLNDKHTPAPGAALLTRVQSTVQISHSSNCTCTQPFNRSSCL